MWDQGFPPACLRGKNLTCSPLRDVEGQEAANPEKATTAQGFPAIRALEAVREEKGAPHLVRGATKRRHERSGLSFSL